MLKIKRTYPSTLMAVIRHHLKRYAYEPVSSNYTLDGIEGIFDDHGQLYRVKVEPIYEGDKDERVLPKMAI